MHGYPFPCIVLIKFDVISQTSRGIILRVVSNYKLSFRYEEGINDLGSILKVKSGFWGGLSVLANVSVLTSVLMLLPGFASAILLTIFL